MQQNELIQSKLTGFSKELSTELNEILNYWKGNTLDYQHGGFFGKINDSNKVDAFAAKGAVLNARILWSFSSAYNLKQDPSDLKIADRAFQYFNEHFIDKQFGGVFWSVDYTGAILDSKKQVYAIAFAIYALSEYYLASGFKLSYDLAILLFQKLEEKCYDPIQTGYFEAFSRDWQIIADLRLSEKDANEKKTMNTHLHVLEAYSNLYRIWPDAFLKIQIEKLCDNFSNHIIQSGTYTQNLFFDENWICKSNVISYGHDIESSWLLLTAAKNINNPTLIDKFSRIAIKMSEKAMDGVDSDGALWYEYDLHETNIIKEKHWWVQAEALVGFFNAWQISNDPKYLGTAIACWDFIKDKILDLRFGEWVWGIDNKGIVMSGEDKVGLWKCPYHNTRACIEIIKRVQSILSQV